MIPVTHGSARVSKTSDTTRNLEPQLHILDEYGIREEHIFTDEMTGSSMSRPAWNELMARVQPELRRGCEDPGGAHQAEHGHRGHQGGYQHRRRQRRGQALPHDDAGAIKQTRLKLEH